MFRQTADVFQLGKTYDLDCISGVTVEQETLTLRDPATLSKLISGYFYTCNHLTFMTLIGIGIFFLLFLLKSSLK